MDEDILRIKLTIDNADWEILAPISSNGKFNKLVKSELNKMLPLVACDKPLVAIVPNKVSKQLAINGTLAPRLRCAAAKANMDLATFVLRYVIIPLAEKNKNTIH